MPETWKGVPLKCSLGQSRSGFLKKKWGTLLPSTGFYVLSLRNNAGLLESLCFVVSLGSAGISYGPLDSHDRERVGRGQR